MTRKEFESLYDSHATSVARFLSHYTRKTDQLEDWVQLVFLKLWIYRHSVDTEGEFLKAYILKTARNVAVTQLKKEKKRLVDYQPDLDKTALPLTEEKEVFSSKYQNTPDRFMERYHEALDKIPPRAHEVYKLSREEGLSYNEIAQALQISPRTVEVHIRKVLRILRKELEEFKR